MRRLIFAFCWLIRFRRRRSFSVVAQHLWNTLPQDVRLATSLMSVGSGRAGGLPYLCLKGRGGGETSFAAHKSQDAKLLTYNRFLYF